MLADHSLATSSSTASNDNDDEMRGSIMTVGDGVMIAGLPIPGKLLGNASGNRHRLIVSGLPSDAMLLIGERSINSWTVEANGLTHIGMMFPKRPVEDVVIELQLQTREGKFVARGRGRISAGSKNAVTLAAAMSHSLKPEPAAVVSDLIGSKSMVRDEMHQRTEIVLKSASENRGAAGVIAQALLPSRAPQQPIVAPQYLGAQTGMPDEKGPAISESGSIAPPRKRPPPPKADMEQDGSDPEPVRKTVRTKKASTAEPRSPKTTTETPPAAPTASLWSSPSPAWRESLFGADKN